MRRDVGGEDVIVSLVKKPPEQPEAPQVRACVCVCVCVCLFLGGEVLLQRPLISGRHRPVNYKNVCVCVCVFVCVCVCVCVRVCVCVCVCGWKGRI